MRWAKTINTESNRLLLIFSGWGTDADTLKDCCIDGCDTVIVWDYNDDDLPTQVFEGYSEIILVAWSFGVFMAGRFLQKNQNLPITLRVAVNGTLHPVNNKLGIPKRIFALTLKRLNVETIANFWQRMCELGPKHVPSQRPVDELKGELSRIEWLYETEGAPDVIYDKIFIADSDVIIPTENQLNAWEAYDYSSISGPHFPDFASLLSTLTIDKNRVKKRFGSVADTYHDNAIAQRRIANRLVNLAPDDTPLVSVLELGCGTGMLTHAFLKRFPGVKKLTLTDLRPIPKVDFSGETANLQCDAEALLYTLKATSFSTVISSSTIQWFNSQQGFFNNLNRILCKGGVALLSTFGPLTFRQLYGLAPRLEMSTLTGLKSMIPDGLKIEKAEEETIDLEFDNPIDVLRHFHLTGVNSIDPSASPFALLRRYPRRDEGKCLITYHPIYLILRKL